MMKVCIGKDSAYVDDGYFTIVFLRESEDSIVSILKHHSCGILGLVHGHGKNNDAHADYIIREPQSGKLYMSSPEMEDELKSHAGDKKMYDDIGATYIDCEGRAYEMECADKYELCGKTPDEGLSIAEKMRKWNCGVKTHFPEDTILSVEMITEKYGAFFGVDSTDGTVYCRLGQNGYCDRGYAMRSTICIRANECRMLEDHSKALEDYKPDESCFVRNGCAFPSDGGWYWSVKSVSDDTILLNGCGGETYTIAKR